MTITDQQRKRLWIAGVVLAALYFAPSVIMYVRQASFAQQQAARQQAARQAAHVTKTRTGLASAGDGTQGNSTVAQSDANATVRKFFGRWQGAAMFPPDRGTCSLKLELRAGAEGQAPLAGYSTTTCAPPLSDLLDQKKKFNEMRVMMLERGTEPIAALLEGTMNGSALAIKVTKVIGTTSMMKNCVPESLSLTPFAADTLGAEFQDTCGGGQLMLHKAR